jgi:D-glycero-alpha-D-manno-heptose 1-phosphate guanylyltransferase
MEAIILAGGFGTRLRARVADVPKPMAPVAGRPFLAWLLDRLQAEGFRRVVLSVGYMRDAIIATFGAQYRGMGIAYAIEERPLGTGGAIRHALLRSVGTSGPVWVMNGDTIAPIACGAMAAAHDARRCAGRPQMTMALVRVPDASRYGAVAVDDDRITGFNAAGIAGEGLINSGVYLLDRDLFAGADLPEAFSFERDFIPASLDRIDLRPFVAEGWFLDIGVPADYDRAQTELPQAVGAAVAAAAAR